MAQINVVTWTTNAATVQMMRSAHGEDPLHIREEDSNPDFYELSRDTESDILLSVGAEQVNSRLYLVDTDKLSDLCRAVGEHNSREDLSYVIHLEFYGLEPES